MDDPDSTPTHSNSNDDGWTPSLITDRRTPGTHTIATPPWLVDNVSASDGSRGRGRSAARNPSERRRRKQTESASCHVSARQRTSILRSRRSCSRSSTLLAREQMLMKPNERLPARASEAGSDRRTSTSVRGRGLVERRLERTTLATVNAPFPVGVSVGTTRRWRPALQPR